jgi:long-chain fatty acid transport protein
MKKFLLSGLIVVFASTCLFGQLVTNTNQSAIYYRLLSRNGTIDLDAVYYNPAGLAFMKDGWHFSLSNQTIDQEKSITNAFPLLNSSEYIGEVKVPIFPNAYAVYKSGKLAFALGFGPNAGGGTADFKTGLPDFEVPLSQLPMLISGFGLPTTSYSADIAFKGKSIFLGIQANVTYAFSDTFALSGGLRYIMAGNTYEGHINDVMVDPYHPLVNPTAQMMPAPQFFTAIGQPLYAAMTSDVTVDVKQTGTAIVPIIGLSFRPNEKWTIGARYEMKGKLTLTNETTVDGSGMFPDGEENRNDIPAIFAIGTDYQLTDWLKATFSYNMYFEKQANLGGAENLVDSNTYSYAGGLEFSLTKGILLSAGYLHTQMGLDPQYQSGMSFELTSDTIGFGGRICLGPSFDIDLGVIFVSYKDDIKPIAYPNIGSFNEIYGQKTWAFTVGLNIRPGSVE